MHLKDTLLWFVLWTNCWHVCVICELHDCRSAVNQEEKMGHLSVFRYRMMWCETVSVLRHVWETLECFLFVCLFFPSEISLRYFICLFLRQMVWTDQVFQLRFGLKMPLPGIRTVWSPNQWLFCVEVEKWAENPDVGSSNYPIKYVCINKEVIWFVYFSLWVSNEGKNGY